MSNKKQRGIRRKTRNMIKRILEETSEFPSDFYNGYWHLHLPTSEGFIDSNRTPIGVKKTCVQTLLKQAVHLIEKKSNSLGYYRVVVYIDFKALFDAQIIVFAEASYFKQFFNRNNDSQKWLPLSKEKSDPWRLDIPQNMKTLGFEESIRDEAGNAYKKDIWFIGELEEILDVLR
ncbi:MAG: DUF3916 domain-containing protein [Psychrobacillus sp.]